MDVLRAGARELLVTAIRVELSELMGLTPLGKGKKMKKILKRLIIGSILERPLRNFLSKLMPSNASIEPIVPFLKSHFKMKKDIAILEVGARYGESSEVLIRNLDCNKYVIVDPYATYEEYQKDGFDESLRQYGGDEIYTQTQKRLKKFITNITFIRRFSDDEKVFDELQDATFDIIYIDGNHEYEYVLRDLDLYYPLVKNGGVLCGDDFHTRSKENDLLNTLPEDSNRPMVYEAVEHFAKSSGLKYEEFGNHRGYGKTFAFIKN